MKKLIVFLCLILYPILLVKNVWAQEPTEEPIVIYNIKHFRANANANNSALYLEYRDRFTALQTLAGIINRDKPRLFLNYKLGYENHYPNTGSVISFDAKWFDKMCQMSFDGTCDSEYPQLNGRPIEYFNENTYPIEQMVNRYKTLVNGLVVWDGRVNATSNAAISIAGADNLIAVRYAATGTGSLLEKIKGQTGLAEKVNFYQMDFTNPNSVPDAVVATGSTKNNVYRWLVAKYLSTGKSNAKYLGYYADAYPKDDSFYINGLSHADWMVKNRGFVFDLSPWGDEKPIDDQNQVLGTDRNTWSVILDTARAKLGGEIGYAHGFLPWPFKYSTYRSAGTHETWQGEHEYINLFSEKGFVNVSTDAESNCCLDEIGDMANASFYSGLDKDEERKFLNDDFNLPKETKILDNTKTYLLFGAGDYDSPAWGWKIATAPKMLGTEANLPSRTIPIFWWITPGIFQQNPVLLDELIKNRKSLDYFGGEYGLGYFDPVLFPDNLKNKLSLETRDIYRKLNYSLTGFVIPTRETRGPRLWTNEAKELLKSYSGDGLGTGLDDSGEPDIIMYGNVPVKKITVGSDFNGGGWIENKDKVLTELYNAASGTGPRFVYTRSIMMFPQWLQEIADTLKKDSRFNDKNWEVVDPYTFFRLVRLKNDANSQSNYYRASYLSDTFPSTMEPGKTFTVSVTIRNDGWDTWSPHSDPERKNYAFIKSIVPAGQGHTWDTYNSVSGGWTTLTNNVAPGQQIKLDMQIMAPANIGDYTWQFDMVRNGVGGFREFGDIPWEKKVEVKNQINIADLNGDTLINKDDLSYLLTHWKEKPEYNLGMVMAILKYWN